MKDRSNDPSAWTTPSPDAAGADADASWPDAQMEQNAREAVAGDPEAINALWRRHRRWVAAILLAHKPRWSDLDDLLQEVAMSVVRKVGELRDPKAVRPWLRTVAINAAHAAGRKGARRSADVSMPEEPEGGGHRGKAAGPSTGDLEDGRRLLALSHRLPDGYREPLLLKAVRGLSYREIGQILGLPETTIETRIARARRMLRELAAEDMPHRFEPAAGGAGC